MPLPRDLSNALIAVVRQRMEEQRMSGRALAGKIGITHVTMAAHLKGEGTVGIDEFEAIAHALGARDVEELLTEARRRID